MCSNKKHLEGENVPKPDRLLGWRRCAAPPWLRLQALAVPRAAFCPKGQAIVQTIGSALPELETIRDDAVSAPGVRARHVLAFETFVEMLLAFFEHRSPFDRFALL